MKQQTQQDRLEKIAENVPGVVYQFQLWPDGRSAFPYASAGIQTIYEVTPEEVREDASPVFAKIHPDDLAAVNESISLSSLNLTVWKLRYRIIRNDGTIIWVEGESTPERMEDGSTLWHGYIRDITELTQASERLQVLLDMASDGIQLVDQQGNLVECSRSFAEQLGYTKSEALKLNVTDWDANFPKSQLNPMIHELIQHPRTFETQYKRKDGSIIPVEISTRPITLSGEKYLYSASRDITERQRSQREVLEANQRFKALLDSSKDGFMLVDTEGRLLDVNPAFCRQSGYSRDELLKLRVTDLDAHESIEDTIRRIEGLKRAGNAIFQSEQRRKDGSIWPIEVSISYVDIQGGLFFSFVRDISKRKINEQISILRNQLAEMVFSGEPEQLLQVALKTIEDLTSSPLSFFAITSNAENQNPLYTWSTQHAEDKFDCAHSEMNIPPWEAEAELDEPMLNNACDRSWWVPKGHCKANRELITPVKNEGKTVAIIGVANKPTDYDQNDVSLLDLIGELTYDFIARRLTEQKIRHMAFFDLLTNLPNRQLFTDRLNQAISLSNRTKHLIAICYLDLDGFKPLNDKFGHAFGDQLLIAFAQRLKQDLREEDTLARLGGDEFVILLNDLKTVSQAEQIIYRTLQRIREPFNLLNQRIYISACIGVSIFPNDNADSDSLLRHADYAMYQAKLNGKGQYKLYDPIENQKASNYQQFLESFERALIENELVLYYQPRVDLRSSDLKSVEALVRWQHPEQGLLFPDQFIPLIADTALEIALDEWVLRNAIKQHVAWRENGLHLAVSVNISPQHIQQETFPGFLSQLLSEAPPDMAQYLELEVLETGAIGDTDHVAMIMRKCTELGIKFSLDDFGTGYSSLTHFHKLPIDVLKIDQNFVRSMLERPDNLDIVEGVLSLARSLNRPVVAEGVESIELAIILLQLGCPLAQGYGISRPIAPENFQHWHHEWKKDAEWRNMNHYSQGPTAHYDINAAIISHELWLNRVRDYVRAPEENKKPNLDPDTCPFAQWYQGAGKTRYGAREAFPEILNTHHEIHVFAQRLISDAKNLDSLMLESRIEKLFQQGNELKLKLNKLSSEDYSKYC